MENNTTQANAIIHPSVVTFADFTDYYVVVRTDDQGGVTVMRNGTVVYVGTVNDLVRAGEYISISVGQAFGENPIDTEPAESVGEAALWVSGDQDETNRFNDAYWQAQGVGNDSRILDMTNKENWEW